jgi:AcrR family transcriptional regulator
VEPAAPESRRERKKRATRDAIRVAALELFVDRGFDGVTVEQICARADVATSTFFRHFPTKEDVVLDDFSDRGRQLLEALDAQPAGIGPTDLLLGASQVWRLSRRPAEVLRAETMLLAAEPALRIRLDQVLVTWEEPIADRLASRYGLDPVSLDLKLAAAWFVTTIRVVIREWALAGGTDDVYAVGARAIGTLSDQLESVISRNRSTTE